MPQIVKVVDVTKSFVVVDPNAFVANLEYTQREDTPEQPLPILAFEGYNFLPTVAGYRSFFGANSILNIQALPARCDKLFIYQFANLKNVLVALCEDGIHISLTAVGGSTWQSPASAVLAIPAVGTHKEWTYCTIANVLYMYRERHSQVFTISPNGINGAGVVTVGAVTPSFLNMAGQMGIFRANGRLGFWDSANSTSWSDDAVKTDMVPSVTTRAGNAIFNGVLGRIVTILSQADGFIIYSTKSITGVRFTNGTAMIWEANQITDNAGIIYPTEVCTGITDAEHYAYTSTGIKKIGTYNALAKSHKMDEVATEVYDLLRESRSPVALQLLEGRYLFLSVIDPNYIYGRVSYAYNSIDALQVRILMNNAAVNPSNISRLPTKIGGSSVSTHIKQQLGLGATLGRYTQWVATGVHMVPPRISPIYQYLFDTSNIHIPNPAITWDTTSQLDSAGVQALVVGGTYADVSSNAYPYAIELGWNYPGLNNVGAAFLGNTDAYLDEFVATQISEWNNFTTIQATTKAAIDAAIPVIGAVIQGNIPYTSAAAGITAQINAYLAANPGSVQVGNSVVVTTKVGELFSGAGTTTGPTIIGAGTTAATMSLTKNLSGGWDVNRITTRNFTARTDGKYYASSALTYTVLIAAPGTYADTTVGPYNTSLEASNALTSAIPTIFSAFPAAWSGVTGGFRYDGHNPHIVGAQYWYIQDYYTYPGGVYQGTLDNSCVNLNATIPAFIYYVDYQDTKTLSTSVNNGLTATKTATAYQENLLWGYFTSQQDPGNFTSTYGAIIVSGTGLYGQTNLPPYADINYPGATFLIQDGSIAPIYPTYVGALVFDTALKKWGKMKNDYKLLLAISPVNAMDAPVTYTDFGIDMAILNSLGQIIAMDARPVDSWIRYGKLAYLRHGVTQVQEIRAHFRTPFTGNVTVDTSIDTIGMESSLQTAHPYTGTLQAHVFGVQAGKWHTIKISGNYDLHYLEFRGNLAGRY